MSRSGTFSLRSLIAPMGEIGREDRILRDHW
jgi:hypothetical protein